MNVASTTPQFRSVGNDNNTTPEPDPAANNDNLSATSCPSRPHNTSSGNPSNDLEKKGPSDDSLTGNDPQTSRKPGSPAIPLDPLNNHIPIMIESDTTSKAITLSRSMSWPLIQNQTQNTDNRLGRTSRSDLDLLIGQSTRPLCPPPLSRQVHYPHSDLDWPNDWMDEDDSEGPGAIYGHVIIRGLNHQFRRRGH